MTTKQQRYYDNHLNEERSKAKERYYKKQDSIAEQGYQRVMCTICNKEISRNGRYCHNKTKQHQVNLKEEIETLGRWEERRREFIFEEEERSRKSLCEYGHYPANQKWQDELTKRHSTMKKYPYDYSRFDVQHKRNSY